jgi:maltose/moltooligosaccharide transporter
MVKKPALSFWQIWNMCFGFLGIQFGFALQNANVSRIFQTLGADVDEIPILWIAAPVTGLLVQPVIGYLSDNTWNRLGRRRPYFLIGAICTTAALFFMPNSPTLWIAAGMLWIMDASINISMEPFRAFVGDMLPHRQRTRGFAMQSFFIGVGAVVASALPWMLSNWLGFDNTAPPGQIPESVKYAFYLGGVVLFLAVGWTVISTREYSPEQLAEFEEGEDGEIVKYVPESKLTPEQFSQRGGFWATGGVVFTLVIFFGAWDHQLYILAAGLVFFGALQFVVAAMARRGHTGNAVYEIIDDMFHMPKAMKQLALVQFFSWFALFAMWIYTTAAVTSFHFGTSDPGSRAYNDGADWVGVLFGSYNGFAAVAALIIPIIANRIGRRRAHLVNLCCGGLGLISFTVIKDPHWLLLSMVGVGIAWASILSVPYAILSGALPAEKMGVYMGIFNFFIVIPQILAASVIGVLVRLLGGEAIYALVIGGVFLIIGGFVTLFVDDSHDPVVALEPA